MPDFVLVQAKSFLQISLKSGLNTEFLQFSVAKKATKTSVFRRKNKQKWGILWVQLSSVPPKTKGKKDLLLTKPVNPSLSRASTMKSGSPFLVDLLG